ncbi:MAG TPA: hypothetical protein VGP07_01145 [Polyangia bacterium]
MSIVSNQGTVTLGGRGPIQAFVYNRIPYGAAGSILYSCCLGVESGTWYPFYLYCSADGRLTRVEGEMTDRDAEIDDEVDGTCTDQGVAAMAPVSLAANTLSPVALTCGFSVRGPGSSIDLEGSQNGNVSFNLSKVVVETGSGQPQGLNFPGGLEPPLNAPPTGAPAAQAPAHP